MKTFQILFYLLTVIGCSILIANAFGKEAASIVTNTLYVIVPGTLFAFSVVIVARNRGDSNQSKAYLLFAGFVSSWFGGELVSVFSELVYHLPAIPQEAEILYFCGYGFLFFFSIYYLKPFWAGISRKMVWYGLAGSLTFLGLTLYYTYSFHIHADLFQIIWASLYPVFDSVVLFPTILGMLLFFRGKVGLLWSLAFIAIVLNIVADSGVLFIAPDRTYYTGNPIDIMYLSAYVLFAFGLYHHIQIFKSPKKKSLGDFKDLR